MKCRKHCKIRTSGSPLNELINNAAKPIPYGKRVNTKFPSASGGDESSIEHLVPLFHLLKELKSP